MNILYFFYLKIKNKRIRQIIIKIILSKEKGYAFSQTLRKIYSNIHGITIGYGSYGGCFNLKNIPPGVVFGNYCSIASEVKIFRANHPLDNFTLHPILYNPVMGYVKKDMLNRPKLQIGNDVWIGANAIILPSVSKIGNGAVIGAGSIVTKDVSEYSIIVGNPARVVKKRFSSDAIQNLEATKWYNMNKEDLIKNIQRLQEIVNDK